MLTRAQYEAKVAEANKMMPEIMDELTQFNELASKLPDTPFVRRLKVRVVCSLIEAQLSHMKNATLILAVNPKYPLLAEDRLALQDTKVIKGTSKGTSKLVGLRLTMKENVKLAMRSFATATGATHKIDFGSKGGANFLKALEIRDKIVHPKRATDWQITTEDVAVIDAAWVWFGQNMVAVTVVPETNPTMKRRPADQRQ